MARRHVGTSLSRPGQVAFWDGRNAEKVIAGTVDPLKQHFLDIFQVAFWNDQNAQNKYAGLFDHFEHRFPELDYAAFWANKMTGNEF
jgi:hypothetical protein